MALCKWKEPGAVRVATEFEFRCLKTRQALGARGRKERGEGLGLVVREGEIEKDRQSDSQADRHGLVVVGGVHGRDGRGVGWICPV